MSESKYRWAILLLTYLCMLGFAFTLQFLPPILTLIIRELKLTHTEAGLLMSLFALPPIFLSILAGFLSDSIGPFKMGVISLILMVGGTLIFAFSNDFLFAGFGRVISGIGASTIAIVSAQILSQWFRGREIGMAMGVYNTAMPVGTIICFTTFGRLAERFNWRVPVYIAAIMAVIGLAAFVILYKQAPTCSQEISLEKEKKVFGLLLGLLKVGILIWFLGLCWMWFNAAVISFSTFAPDFFVLKGYSIGFAGFLVSFLMWGSLGLSPIIGRLVDRFKGNEVFIGIGGLILAISIYLVSRTGNFIFPMIIMAVAVAFVPSPVFSFPSRFIKVESLGLIFGILFMFSSMGMFFGPYIAGFIRDKTGSYRISFDFLSIFALLVTLTAVIIRIKIKRNEQYSNY